jgi:hypothetical protein
MEIELGWVILLNEWKVVYRVVGSSSWSAMSAKHSSLSQNSSPFGFSLKCSQDLSLSLSRVWIFSLPLPPSLPPLQQTRLTQHCFPHFGLLFVGARSLGAQSFLFLRCTNLAAQGQIMLWKLWPNLGGCVFCLLGGLELISSLRSEKFFEFWWVGWVGGGK